MTALDGFKIVDMSKGLLTMNCTDEHTHQKLYAACGAILSHFLINIFTTEVDALYVVMYIGDEYSFLLLLRFENQSQS